VYDTRELLMPTVFNGAKAADHAATALGLVVSTIASLALPYYNGGANVLIGQWGYHWADAIPLNFLASSQSSPYPGSWTNGLHILGGFVGVLGLLILRAYYGFGLHPAGFLGSSVHALHVLWFSIFVGWAIKSLVQRYGGLKGYRILLPFFLGLIVGDVLNAGVWIVISHLTGTAYNLMPT
jgi:hypothetical protein